MHNKLSKIRQKWRVLVITVLSICFSLSPVLLLKPHAAVVPSFFTVDSIMQEGIEDRNFAEAIYESISKQIDKDNYIVDNSWDTKGILLNYGKETPISYLAIIDARKRGIRSISGIKLLKNTGAIRLSLNNIHDLTPLKRDFDDSEDKLYFNNTQITIDINNFQNIIPSELVGVREGNITVDSTLLFEESLVNYIYQDNTERTITINKEKKEKKINTNINRRAKTNYYR